MKTNYYDETYFDWQRNQGLFGGRKNRATFAPYVQPTDCVLDFGCGGGYLLAQIDVAQSGGVRVAYSVEDMRNFIHDFLSNGNHLSDHQKVFLANTFGDTLDGESGRRAADVLLRLVKE